MWSCCRDAKAQVVYYQWGIYMKANKIDKQATRVDSAHMPYQGGPREFEGQVKLQRLVTGEDSDQVELLAVWFSAGARTRAHTHDVDQVLHIMEGRGIVADEHERRVVSAGDIITVRANAWHWHGATPDSSMMHISIRKQGAKTDWDVDQAAWVNGYELDK